jgi:hypothetical protein
MDSLMVSTSKLIPYRKYLNRFRLKRVIAARPTEPPRVVHWAGYFLVINGTHRTYARIAAGERELEIYNLGSARSMRERQVFTRAISEGRLGPKAFLALRIYSRYWTNQQLELELP